MGYMKYLVLMWICCTTTYISMSQNYQEDKIPPYTTPELLVTSDGQKVTQAAAWEEQRRNEILDLFESDMYGRVPKFDYEVDIFRRPLVNQALQGLATQEEIIIDISNQQGRIRLNMLLTLPSSIKGPAPIFLGLNFYGNHVASDNPEVSLTSNYVINSNSLGITDHLARESLRGKRSSNWPVEAIIKNGFGLATVHCGDIDPDFDDSFKNGAHMLAPGPNADQWGTIAAWAWGLSRAMDYLQTDQRVDSKRVAVVGHSRLGKTALWAGAVDSRFALVISNNSGCGGAALSRRRIGETVNAINNNFPHWFCKNFHQYNHREDALPIDQHMLIALIAPRPVYVASATEDKWADPKGEYTSLLLANEVYQLYGNDVLPSSQPPADAPISIGNQGYHLRTGVHAMTPYDWEQYLRFAENHLKQP